VRLADVPQIVLVVADKTLQSGDEVVEALSTESLIV
jgi:hypothetical protein